MSTLNRSNPQLEQLFASASPSTGKLHNAWKTGGYQGVPVLFKLEEKSYNRQQTYQMFWWRTIPDGEAILTTDSWGNSTVLEGPGCPFISFSTVENLRKVICTTGQYLIIEYKTGEKEHVAGPAWRFFNPVLHNSITVAKCLTIETGQAVVIYKTDKKTNQATTEILHGPAVRVLDPDEWCQMFTWKIPDQRNPTNTSRENVRFLKLRTVPDQLYFTVSNVRTSDDAILQVKLMIFYHLIDVNAMLTSTHDPCAELINGLTADVVDFASARTFDEFKRDSHLLNKMDVYHQTNLRVKTIGYNLSKVVFRGVDEPLALETMHNSAIETRTSMQLASESEKQAQELEAYKLACKKERVDVELSIEKQNLRHEQELAQQRYDQQMKQDQETHTQQLLQDREKEQAELKLQRERAAIEEEHLKNVKSINQSYYKFLHDEVGVDVTALLVAENSRADKTVRFLSDSPMKNQLVAKL